MIYDFHPDAQQELEYAVAYYDSINPELAHAFLDEIEHTLERIIKFPEAWSKLSANTRRCRMMGFPYGIIYQIKNQRIVVIAVMHLQRKPNYWTDRKF
jgi:plasmid stabilization system protein ParE